MSLTGHPLTDRLVPVATRLIGAVREFDAEEVAAAINEAEAIDPADGLHGLILTLAAMVPYDATPGELLEWVAHRNEFERLVALGIDPASAATIINNIRKGHGRPQSD